jgi:ice-binding like protein
VYWQINGAVSLGDSSVFAGTILANGAIGLLESASLTGRALSIAGAISLQNNIISIGTQTPGVLPIELLSFSAGKVGEDVQLNWVTASEINNNYFTVERSVNGASFEEVVQVQGARNSNAVLYYV